jgi:hypothetical protein
MYIRNDYTFVDKYINFILLEDAENPKQSRHYLKRRGDVITAEE